MRALQLAAAALALAPVPAAQGTSIVSMPHQPENACGKIALMVRDLNLGRLRGERQFWPRFYSDEFGYVDADEEAGFLAALRTSNGRPDERGLEIHRVHTLDREDGIYLLTLTRVAWELVRYEQNEMLLYDEIPDPHYEEQRLTWIVNFGGGRQVYEVREADGLYPLWDELEELTGCRTEYGVAIEELPIPLRRPSPEAVDQGE